MLGAERNAGTGRGRRWRRFAIAAAAAATATVTAVTVPGAFADEQTLELGDSVVRLPVDESLLGVVQVGEVADVAESLTGGAERTVELHDPGASYVKVHFERLLLAEGDYVTVASPDGTESHRYEESGIDRWATSITGDTAVVELHGTSGGTAAALGAVIDRAAYGYPAEVVDRIIEDRESAAPRAPESICKYDDKRPSPCYEESHPGAVGHTDPVARLLIDGTVLCTAFRVGERNRMLTNSHCFSQSWEARRTEAWFGYDCTDCGGEEATAPVKVTGRRVHASSQELDYTLFSVTNFTAIERFGSLELSTSAARRGDAIYIPQHPAGRPTEIAMESSVDGGECVVKQPVYDGYVADSDVAYYCDTEFGSSGSPVLSRDSHEVVALHHFGGCPNSGVSAPLVEQEIRHLI
ncbi:trypsin-like serine peptidase [Glycomyces xiaoerkulensis]|uniref:trypsin-like serine peptidase n=1 Tax=Glycomyces xiaoerkulensis TaxID=2038139 RepID=UPI0012FFF954|nr:serine protease [Glycomyces xiaoerkulensis]